MYAVFTGRPHYVYLQILLYWLGYRIFSLAFINKSACVCVYIYRHTHSNKFNTRKHAHAHTKLWRYTNRCKQPQVTWFQPTPLNIYWYSGKLGHYTIKSCIFVFLQLLFKQQSFLFQFLIHFLWKLFKFSLNNSTRVLWQHFKCLSMIIINILFVLTCSAVAAVNLVATIIS